MPEKTWAVEHNIAILMLYSSAHGIPEHQLTVSRSALIKMILSLNVCFDPLTPSTPQIPTTASSSLSTASNLTSEVDIMYSYNVTKLRRDPSYITFYVNWFLLLTTGLLPMVALIYLNAKIYAKILETRSLREKCRIQSSTVVALQKNDEDGKNGVNVEIVEDNEISNTGNAVVTVSSSANQIKSVTTTKRHEAMSAKDFRMARVLLSIVVVFFLCHLPR